MGAMAEMFVEYARPLLDEADGSEEGLNKAFSAAQLCYNLALSPEPAREEMLSAMRSTLTMTDEEFEGFRSKVIVPMIDRLVSGEQLSSTADLASTRRPPLKRRASTKASG